MLVNWWVVFKGPKLDSRIKTPDVRILVLQSKYEVMAVEHNSLDEWVSYVQFFITWMDERYTCMERFPSQGKGKPKTVSRYERPYTCAIVKTVYYRKTVEGGREGGSSAIENERDRPRVRASGRKRRSCCCDAESTIHRQADKANKLKAM